MAQTQSTKTADRRRDTEVQDPLQRVRAAAQELHAALGDAASRDGHLLKEDLQSVAGKLKAVAVSLESSVAEQTEVTRQHLGEAATWLAETQKHLDESLASKGEELQVAVRKTLSDAHAVVRKLSEALAAKRSSAAVPKKG